MAFQYEIFNALRADSYRPKVQMTEERLVNVMGGTIIESESERLVRIGREKGEEIGIYSIK